MRAYRLWAVVLLACPLLSQDSKPKLQNAKPTSKQDTAAQSQIIDWRDIRAEKQFDSAAALYDEGKYAQAAVAYKDACDHLNAKACTNLGFMYRNAVGMKRNYKLAADLYRRGCDYGNALGCADLGVMFWEGRLPKNDQGAVELFRKACNASDGGGCVALGFMYENGQGVQQDKAQARDLYRAACNLSNDRGCLQLSLLQSRTEEADATPLAQ